MSRTPRWPSPGRRPTPTVRRSRSTTSTGAPVAVRGPASTTVSGGASRVGSDTVPYQGQTARVRRDRHQRRPGHVRPGQLQRLRRRRHAGDALLGGVDTPNPDYRANASFTLGDSRSRGYDKVNWRTSAGRSGSWDCSAGCSGGTAADLGNTQQSMEIQACNVAGRCSPWSNNVGFHPYGPTKPVTNTNSSISGSGGSFTITFSWDVPDQRPPDHRHPGARRPQRRPRRQRPLHHVQRSAATTRKSITVRARVGRGSQRPRDHHLGADAGQAQPEDHLLRPGQPVPERLPRRHPEQQLPVRHRVLPPALHAAGLPGCDQLHLRRHRQNGRSWGADDGTGGTIEPSNGTNNSHKFYGLPTGSVTRDLPGRQRSGLLHREPVGSLTRHPPCVPRPPANRHTPTTVNHLTGERHP